MKDNYLQHSRKITVAVSDTDFKARIKPSAIMGYCQDIATEHADILKVGYDDMREKNLGWVMLRMSFMVLQAPNVGDVLTVQTFPEKPKSADVNRGYYIINKNGETVIAASSKWCAIDLSSHRIQRCGPIFERFSDSDFIPTEPLANANPKIGKLPDCTEEAFTYTVQVTDLDYNVHMNNARYGDIILNICGMETLEKLTISRLDINFMSQLFAGDSFEVRKAQDGDATYIEAKKLGEETVVFRARVEWKKA